ncbi:Cytochrome c, mono-and diheme variants [Loktanella atrilutea]|uniref:Cytochrome c, mono-and diheme variants n=1 Tax=Loktanella atrilutea TaxID=366533 RepID=A0A1M5ERV9_LOKAT|nr:cytochrome c [Loktanella atrilutea]SHF81851.1 Cytochrome c, mono-and diheme variants [Loktanella atrilutea]
MRWLVVPLVLGGVLASAGIFTVSRWTIVEPVTLGMMEGDAQRGAYLARSAGCVACHTDVQKGGAALAGGAPLDTPFGRFVPPNLTPDPVHGIGNWTLDQFAVAVRQGVRPDGKAYYPAFTYEFYNRFTDQDIADLWTAFRTVPPVPVAAARHDLNFPFNLRWGLQLWRARYMTPSEMTPVMAQSDAWNRGQQLVNGASHCAACHTARGLFGGLDTSESLAGNANLPGGNKAPSIRTEALLTRGWTVANMAYALRTGIMPDGDVLGGSMAEAIAQGTGMLTGRDREAIATYLLTPAGQTSVGLPTPVTDPTMGGMAGMEGMAGMKSGGN